MRAIILTLTTCVLTSEVVFAHDAQDKANPRLEEVLVTAQRNREERLLETPVSVGVLSGDALDRSSARGVADLVNQVGGVTVTEIQPGRTEIVVRGVVPGGVGVNTTAYYLDEVPFAFIRLSELPDSNAFDLARVEVLRGPQGTIYGANSLSGVLRILTNDAKLDEFEAKGRTQISTTHSATENYGGDLMLNVPLIPGQLAVRAVAGYSELSGYIDSRLGGAEINDTRAQNYRFKANWQPTENLRAKLGYSRSEIDNGAPSQALDDLTTPFSSNQPDQRMLDVYNLVLEYSWPTVSLLSSSGYVDYAVDTQREIFLSGTARLGFLNQSHLKSFSQEVRLVSRLEGSWQWSAGAAYTDAEHRTLQNARPVLPGLFISEALSESHAVFGELTRSFADDKFEATVGVRYFNDDATLKDLGSFNPAAVLVPGQSTEFDKTTGRFVLNYKPRPVLMLYGSVASGFRSGMIQSPEVTRGNPGFPSVDPDTLLSYELGVKGSSADRSMSYETAVYYMDWKDIQQSLVLPVGFTARVNAGSASGMGVDAALSYQPTDGLALNASIGWNDLTFDEDVFNFDSVARQNRLLFPKGSRLNDSPEWSGSVGASYSVATPRQGMDFVVSSNFTYGSVRTLRFLTAGVVSETASDEMRRLNASFGLDGDHWSLNLYGDNLLNDDGAVTPPDINVAGTAIRQRPRTIGLQMTFDY